MLNRTSRLLCAGALVLAPALAACGTTMPTDAIYTPAQGVNERSKDVDVLNALIVSAEEGKGTLVVTLANNQGDPVDGSSSGADKLTAVSVDGEAAEFEPVEIPASRAVVVATKTDAMPDAVGGIEVEGDFEAGDFVTVVFTFEKAGEVEVNLPVLRGEEGTYVADQVATPAPSPAEEADHGEADH